jgi:hypothetical protein
MKTTRHAAIQRMNKRIAQAEAEDQRAFYIEKWSNENLKGKISKRDKGLIQFIKTSLQKLSFLK